MANSDLTAHVLDLLRPWGGVSARRMFGGHGLYRQNVMFALIADDVLYLKVDDRNRAAFKEAGMEPFAYAAQGRTVTIASYYEAPSELFDDPDMMRTWARMAFEAALAAHSGRSAAAARSRPGARLRRARPRRRV